jgi:cysteine desulfurase/selenocysteine lyase
VAVVSFNVCSVHPHDVASILDGAGVAIRAGHHCAQPPLSWMGVSSCCRASLALYNDSSDIDCLVNGLKQVWELFNG